jgi:hypothetical protein
LLILNSFIRWSRPQSAFNRSSPGLPGDGKTMQKARFFLGSRISSSAGTKGQGGPWRASLDCSSRPCAVRPSKVAVLVIVKHKSELRRRRQSERATRHRNHTTIRLLGDCLPLQRMELQDDRLEPPCCKAIYSSCTIPGSRS